MTLLDTRQEPASASTLKFLASKIYPTFGKFSSTFPVVATLIDQHMQLQLTESNYAAVHIRSQYLRTSRMLPNTRRIFATRCIVPVSCYLMHLFILRPDRSRRREYTVTYGRESRRVRCEKRNKSATAIAVVARQPTDSSNGTGPSHLTAVVIIW
jgi:hypothetical protein